MKALVYRGRGKRLLEDVADPQITDPADVIIRMDAVTICGTDLHILKGDVPACEEGTILGHEAVGTVLETGPAVRTLRVGDRVLASCITACGRCRYCRESRYGQCLGGGGWILGHRINGTQAERIRVPFADTSAYVLPESVTDESALLLADILPTSYEVGVLAGRVEPGDTVVIVGAGPIGLAAITTAQLLSPSHIIVVDPAESRRNAAVDFGAQEAVPDQAEALTLTRHLTNGLGADVVIEAVGIPETFEMCTTLVRAGGHVANAGVHGKPATLHLEDLWIKDVTMTTGLVDTFTTPTLLHMLPAGKFDTGRFITHRFEFPAIEEAYDTFSRPQDTGALKVALFRV